MNKKIILVGLFLVSLFLIPTIVVCLNVIKQDSKNDIIFLEEYNFDFDFENFDPDDLEQIKDLDYVYSYNRPQLDIQRVIMRENVENTNFLIEVLSGQWFYPSPGSNAFVLVVVLVDGNNIFAAVNVKSNIAIFPIEISKYGFVDIKNSIENITEDDFKDFSLLNDGNGKLFFDIPTDDLPDNIDDIYIVIGEATISNVDLNEITFTINDLYVDIYPNSLYGGSLVVPVGDTEDTSDDTNDNTEEVTFNPFETGLILMILVVVIGSAVGVGFGLKK